MKNSSVYVQPSRTEAHCVAVEEALVLECPIVVTDIPSFRGQLKNKQTGMIAEKGPTGLADAIEQLCTSGELFISLKENLYKRNKRQLNQLHPLVDLMEGE